MDLLEGLNEEQRRAVEHGQGPLLVVAGAGTGKTQVITRRIAYLIEKGAADPAGILALTFTEKAAREMEERLYDLIGWRSFQVPVMTFNAFGAELLGRYAADVGRSIRGGLLNDTQKILLLQQNLQQIKLDYFGHQSRPYEFCQRIIAYIGKLQNSLVTPDGYDRFVAGLQQNPGDMHPADVAEQNDLSRLYRLYEAVKISTGTFDFHDQLALPLDILKERPNLAERLTRQYRYVLVDEYQDTSPVQDALLRTFVPPDGNILAVGDDDQAIYSFRGADLTNILEFTNHFKKAATVTLVQNYRSGQPVLDAAYRLITHNNPLRLEERLHISKQLKAQTSEAEVKFVPYRNPEEERQSVAAALKSELADGTAAADMAVLARSHAALQGLAKALDGQGVPYLITLESPVFSQREVLGLWHLMRWIAQRADETAMAHVVLGLFIGWRPAQWRTLAERARQELVSIEAALAAEAQEGNPAAADLAAQLEAWRRLAHRERPSKLAYDLVFQGPVVDKLRHPDESDLNRTMKVIDDFQRFLLHLQDFETLNPAASLLDYLDLFPEPPRLESSQQIGDPDGVQLLTVHAAKGLEFQKVFVVGCTQRSWSEQPEQGIRLPEGLAGASELPPEHEQRRLMYVAVTRAKRQLVLSAPLASAGGQRQLASRFISELIEEVPGILLLKPDQMPTPEESLQKLQQFYPLKQHQPDKLPFITADDWLELGVSAIEDYDECPYDFFLQHVLGIQQPFGAPMSFGSALHKVFQLYNEARLRGEPAGAGELEELLRQNWDRRGYASAAEADTDLERAVDTLHKFIRREGSLNRRLEAAEFKITLEIPEAKLRLRGKIDLAAHVPEGGIEIRDYKTGRGKTDLEKLEKQVKEHFQLRTYALAYQQLTGQKPRAVTLDYVVTGVEASAELTDRVLANHRDKLAALADCIRRRDFAPKQPPPRFHTCAATTFYGDLEEDEDA